MTGMCTKVLAAVAAVLLMVSARAEGDTAQPPSSTSSAGAKASEKRAETVTPERKRAKKQGKSGETHKPEATGSGTQQEKSKQPCEEVKPCAIE